MISDEFSGEAERLSGALCLLHAAIPADVIYSDRNLLYTFYPPNQFI